MIFKSLQMIYLDVNDAFTDNMTIDVMYKALETINMVNDDIYVHLVIQENSVNMWYENDVNDSVAFLTDEEERYVMERYMKDTLISVAKYEEGANSYE